MVREEKKLRGSLLQAHNSFRPEIKKVATSDISASLKMVQLVKLGNEWLDELEHQFLSEARQMMSYTSDEVIRFMNLMLPVGEIMPHQEVRVDLDAYMDREFKGMTSRQRLARIRIKTRKKLNAAFTRELKEAIEPKKKTIEYALSAWDAIVNHPLFYADNELWLASMYAYHKTAEAQVDVLDGYEHLATLDELTCEECAALDGQEILPTADPEEATNIHASCRCTFVPVTKTWRELGFDMDELPEGNRIARPYYPVGKPGAYDWGKSSPDNFVDPKTGKHYDKWRPGLEPRGGTQNYVPANMRYEDWKARRAS